MNEHLEIAGGYIPYFYQSGKFLNYDQPQQIKPSSSTSGYSSYDFSSEMPTWPQVKKPQTVEQIIAHGYFAIPDGELETAIFRQVAAQGAPADNRQQYSATKLTQELYEQMRLERVTLWKDISRLKQSLPEVAQNYFAAYRKVAILEDNGGDKSPPAPGRLFFTN